MKTEEIEQIADSMENRSTLELEETHRQIVSKVGKGGITRGESNTYTAMLISIAGELSAREGGAPGDGMSLVEAAGTHAASDEELADARTLAASLRETDPEMADRIEAAARHEEGLRATGAQHDERVTQVLDKREAELRTEDGLTPSGLEGLRQELFDMAEDDLRRGSLLSQIDKGAIAIEAVKREQQLGTTEEEAQA